MDSLWLLIGITALAGIGGTGLGGLVACLFRKDSSKTVSLLLSFAAGVMTSVVCFDLLAEALHTSASTSTVFLVVAGVMASAWARTMLNSASSRHKMRVTVRFFMAMPPVQNLQYRVCRGGAGYAPCALRCFCL